MLINQASIVSESLIQSLQSDIIDTFRKLVIDIMKLCDKGWKQKLKEKMQSLFKGEASEYLKSFLQIVKI